MTAIEDKVGGTIAAVSAEVPEKVFPPELKEAVMVAGPAATAVASPETDIVAVDVFDELQVTVLEMSFVEPSE